MTKSEQIFNDIFIELGITPYKIPESSIQTPDYEIILNGIKTYWEIKELEENEKEKEIINKIQSDQQDIYSVNSERVNNSIKTACAQFKNYKVTNFPCVIVIYDSRDFATKDVLFHQFIQVSMVGTAEYMKMNDGSYLEIKRNPGLLTNRKKYISAVAAMHESSRELIFFHNANASISLIYNPLLKKFRYQYHFVKTNSGYEWQPV